LLKRAKGVMESELNNDKKTAQSKIKLL